MAKQFLAQPNEFMVPENDRQTVAEIIKNALGYHIFDHFDPSTGSAIFEFKSKMNMDYCEAEVRKHFALEIANKEGFWSEWNLEN